LAKRVGIQRCKGRSKLKKKILGQGKKDKGGQNTTLRGQNGGKSVCTDVKATGPHVRVKPEPEHGDYLLPRTSLGA